MATEPATADRVEPSKEANTQTPPDSGLSALAMIASFHQLACEPEQIRHELGIGVRASTALDITRAARQIKLKSRLLRNQKPARLEAVPLPVIIELEENKFFLIGRRLSDGTWRIIDAASRAANHIPAEDVLARWNGTVILITKRASIKNIGAKFGLNWFLPSIWRYRKPLANVVLASLFVQLCALITPLFFQITIDKVLTHKGYSTLSMVFVGLMVIGAFNVLLQFLRAYILNHTTSRIDVELGTRLFEHLLRLPLGYFETRPAGQTIARVRELDNVRSFLTGQGLTAMLDVPFTLIFLAVLYFYSAPLAFIVTLATPCYVLVAILLRPILRARTIERFNRNALSNQFLIESVVGIHTIKAMAVEPMLRVQWEERLAAYVKTSFQAVMLGSLGQNAIQYISTSTTALVLFFGAYQVINGSLTVGSLIAFNMITSQVTAPILRLSQLWQDFQQVKVSIERLGDVLDAQPETSSMAQAHLPTTKGHFSVRNVVFRYQHGLPEVLKNVSIEVLAGQVVGIVGPSGSGKSTFTKLSTKALRP